MGHFTFDIFNLFSVLIQYIDSYISDQKPHSLSLYLLSGDAHVVPHVRENSGLNEEPFQAQSFASTLQLGSFADAALDKLQHTILLLPTDLWGRRMDIKWEPKTNRHFETQKKKIKQVIKREQNFCWNESPMDVLDLLAPPVDPAQ